MRAPVSWLRELCGVTEPLSGAAVAADLVKVGLEEEGLHGGDITGPLVVGRVLDKTDEVAKNGKTIHFCHVDVGPHGQRLTDGVAQEIVCGAHNFAAGDLVVVVLPGATLAGGFEISARKTYGHDSNGMICSEAELGLSEQSDGIIVLTDYLADQPELVGRLEPGMDVVELLGLGDEVVEVNVTPDRGYCFSMRGIAREYALATGRDTFRDPVAVDVPEANVSGYVVRLLDEAPIRGRVGCDRYVARIVRGVDVTATSPTWMTTRLTQMGMRSISLAVDVTNYLMLLTGQPLHAFDLDALSGSIEVRRARPGESLTTLDDVVRRLDPADLLITDGGHTPLALAGVMGGATSEVTAATTNLLIEAAHFDATTVARTSRRHKLSTEASKRYERGVDADMTAAVNELAVRLLVELGGGSADPGVTDVDLRRPRPSYTFDTRQPWDLIEPAPTAPAGLDHAAVVASLRAIGCSVQEPEEREHRHDGFSRVQVLPPSWRPDLVNGPDLVEEVARIRGYDQISSVLPAAPAGRGLTRAQRSVRLVGTALAAQGLTEVLTYPFVSPTHFDALGHDALDDRRMAVRLANPLSDEHPLLRTNVLDTLLGTLRVNVGRGTTDVGLFEVGLVVRPGDPRASAPIPPVGERPDESVLDTITAAVPHQPRHLAIALTGAAVPEGPWGPSRPYAATDAVALARVVGEVLGVALTISADSHSPWHPGRCAAVALPDGTLIGHAGELHPKVVTTLDLPPRTCAVEMDLDALLAGSGTPVQARPLSTYPIARSDVALVVADDVSAAAVESALRSGAGESLEAVVLFDVYRGDQVGEGKKSLAYRLSFRASDRTLTTAAVSAARDAAIASAALAVGAVQR